MTESSLRLRLRIPALLILAISSMAVGCQSPYYADRGAGFGALAGAGTGAIIGHATGNTGAGTAIGAGIGALTGATVGTAMDDMAAQNRAQIATQLGRQVQAGAANINEVVAMSRAGVEPRLIQNYIRTSGVAKPLSAQDVIYLHNQGVATDVIQAMQTPTVPNGPVVAGRPPVIVEEPLYGPPACYGPHYGYYRHRGPQLGWGVTIAR